MQRAEALARCKQVSTSGIRMREQVVAIDVGADQVVALSLDPFKAYLTTVDGEGTVRVTDYGSSNVLNRFPVNAPGAHFKKLLRAEPCQLLLNTVLTVLTRFGAVRAGERCAPVKMIYQLNEMHNGLLMTCSEDGGVKVWRDFTVKGEQRLATAWQSVLLQSQSLPDSRTAYCLAEEHGASTLYAAGGRGGSGQAPAVNAWDLRREHCVAQLVATDQDVSTADIEHLASSHSSPLLFAADATGLLRVFDLRTSSSVGTVHHLRERLAGMVAEPGGLEHQVVLGYRSGNISFLDCRMSGGRAQSSLLRSIEGHSKGHVTTVCSHPHAPLFATATASQVVKVWSMRGEQVGVVRAHTSFLPQRIGPITCLAFSPYSLSLASGGGDSICAVYLMDIGRSSR